MYKILTYGSHSMALKIDSLRDAKDHLEGHMENGDAVLFVNELEDVEDFGLCIDDIEIVEPEQD